MLSYLRVSLSNSPRDKKTQLLQLFPTSNLILPKLIHHFIVLSHRDLERQFRFFSPPSRIVSFATSATEEQYCEMDLCKKRAKICGEKEEEEEGMDPQPRRDRRNSRPIVNGPPPRNDGRRGCQRILLARILFPLREAPPSPSSLSFIYAVTIILTPSSNLLTKAVEPWNSLTLLNKREFLKEFQREEGRKIANLSPCSPGGGRLQRNFIAPFSSFRLPYLSRFVSFLACFLFVRISTTRACYRKRGFLIERDRI